MSLLQLQCKHFTGDAIPDWRDLHSNVVSQYAVHWEAIGAELGLEHYHIEIISKDYHNRTEDGCAAMLRKWREMGTSPTWGALDDVINKVMKQKKQATDFNDGGRSAGMYDSS